MKRIGIIETGRPMKDLASRYGNFPQMFRNYFADLKNADFSVFQVFENTPLPAVDACDAWIITGSPAGVYEDHPWIQSLMAFVRQTGARSIPALGICFGHQLMAQAYGGTVAKSDKGRGIGVHRYKLTEAGEKLAPGAKAINLIAAHQDQITEPPPGATLLASSDFCAYAAFAYGKYALSLQGHPEFTPDFERALITIWQQASPVPEATVDKAMETLDTMQPDAQRIAPSLGCFLTLETAF